MPVEFMPTCPYCGNTLPPPASAFLCGDDGGQRFTLPVPCADRQCQLERADSAIKSAVERGIIDP